MISDSICFNFKFCVKHDPQSKIIEKAFEKHANINISVTTNLKLNIGENLRIKYSMKNLMLHELNY